MCKRFNDFHNILNLIPLPLLLPLKPLTVFLYYSAKFFALLNCQYFYVIACIWYNHSSLHLIVVWCVSVCAFRIVVLFALLTLAVRFFSFFFFGSYFYFEWYVIGYSTHSHKLSTLELFHQRQQQINAIHRISFPLSLMHCRHIQIRKPCGWKNWNLHCNTVLYNRVDDMEMYVCLSSPRQPPSSRIKRSEKKNQIF